MKPKPREPGNKRQEEAGPRRSATPAESSEIAPHGSVPFEPLPEDAIVAPCRVAIAAAVVQAIRRHARSSLQAEVCGVLIGEERPDGTLIEAAIAGENASQGGAHVTFTQDTWEHIYAVKDRDYPQKRIVGWYHSHPGFGIFLSRHDAFIHENFFSAPFQVAWVFDPHSDEEGCFGWVDGKLSRLNALRVIDNHSQDDAFVQEEPILSSNDDNNSEPDSPASEKRVVSKSGLRRKLVLLFCMALVFVAGLAAGLLVLPRTLVMYSLPDGRLLSEAEMRDAVERARAFQREQQRGAQDGSSADDSARSEAEGGPGETRP